MGIVFVSFVFFVYKFKISFQLLNCFGIDFRKFLRNFSLSVVMFFKMVLIFLDHLFCVSFVSIVFYSKDFLKN